MTSLRHLAAGRSVDEAIRAAVAELSAGLPTQANTELRRDKRRVGDILREARTSQLPVLARRLADEPHGLLTGAADHRPALGGVARDAANDLLSALAASGRVLARYRDEKVGQEDFPLFLALVGIAEAEAVGIEERNRASGALLARPLIGVASNDDYRSLGPVLGTMWLLAPNSSLTNKDAAARLHEEAVRYAHLLLPDFGVEVEKATSQLAVQIDLEAFLAAAIRAGSRRLAFLDGTRSRP